MNGTAHRYGPPKLRAAPACKNEVKCHSSKHSLSDKVRGDTNAARPTTSKPSCLPISF